MGWKDRDNKSTIEMSVIFLCETEKAVQVRDGVTEIWIPKSLCNFDDNHNLVSGDEIELYVEEWFAKKEGLI